MKHGGIHRQSPCRSLSRMVWARCFPGMIVSRQCQSVRVASPFPSIAPLWAKDAAFFVLNCPLRCRLFPRIRSIASSIGRAAIFCAPKSTCSLSSRQSLQWQTLFSQKRLWQTVFQLDEKASRRGLAAALREVRL